MAKPATVKIRLVSTADTGFFYVTKKNPRNQTEKMSFRKYDPVVCKHVEFKERIVKSIRPRLRCAARFGHSPAPWSRFDGAQCSLCRPTSRYW